MGQPCRNDAMRYECCSYMYLLDGAFSFMIDHVLGWNPLVLVTLWSLVTPLYGFFFLGLVR